MKTTDEQPNVDRRAGGFRVPCGAPHVAKAFSGRKDTVNAGKGDAD
jgi:hypothetical protein